MRILIVEDEVRLADTLGEIMHTQKYAYDIVYNGADGLSYGESDIYDVIVLDIMLPKMNGFDVVKNLRNKKIKTPVILLTARDEILDKVKGLDCGADDYLTKPFSAEELLARIRAVSRRQGEVVLDELKFADIILNLANYSLSSGKKSVHLGYKEFEIMRLLMSNHTSVVPKEDILTKVWGYDSEAEDNNVEVYISFLRKKLQFLDSKVNISTVRKIGYHLEE
ncbi:MAG: DNA-binding response regulator [Clostridiales bacterium GWF2_36_10]|nr:MAG: DNA-binding response regulator [Clostridiales bacterium GWF2_36_10]HAN21026.1 DNA-binding response regulator [Clostridiales bacterium]